MLRAKLKDIFLKNRTKENKGTYIKQRNLCVILLRKSKREYFNNSNEKNVCGNKYFWKVAKPYYQTKLSRMRKIAIVEGDSIISSKRN